MGNGQISVIVVVCGACVLVAALVVIVLCRRKEKEQMELMEHTELPAAASRRGSGSGSPIESTSSSEEDEEQGDIEQEQMYGSRTKNAQATKSAPLSSRTLMATDKSSIRMIHVIATAGKLGVIVDTPHMLYYNRCHCHGSASGFQKRWDCIGIREFLFEII
mmetsp:Transcript_4548/g.7259  ORF Transcript_4548/g.7259 Transcript_4548/m.7259 type:complete len:162 (-) Transcript_4548:1126-1611(-)